MTKPIKVGVYPLGLVDVAVYLVSGTGASFNFAPMNGHPTIKIGVDGGWSTVHSRLHHEAYEMAYVLNGLRYVPSFDCAKDNGAYLFSMTHTQFSESSAQSASFLCKVLPELAKVFNKLAKK